MKLTNKELFDGFINKCDFSIFPVAMPSKKATLKWAKYQHEKIDYKTFIDNMPPEGKGGIAVACGKISSNLEIIDFDNKFGNIKDVYTQYTKIPEVNEIIAKYTLPMESTISGGYHLFFRCSIIEGNRKLARKLNPSNNTVETIIETRGEGGYVIITPTPGYKLGYGDFAHLPVITPEEREILLDHCIRLNEYYGNYSEVEKTKKIKDDRKKRIGDIFNQDSRSTSIVMETLQNAGYGYIENKGDSQFWTRPGKKTGTSCCYNGSTLYVWSTNCAPFESERAYNNFYVYAYLKHNMDFAAAAKELANMGFKPEEEEEEKSRKNDNLAYHHFLRIETIDGETKHYIDYKLYIDFLSNAGFRRYDQKSDFIYIRVKDNIVEQVYLHNIVDYVVSSFTDHLDLNYILKNQKNLVKKDQLICLPIFDNIFNTDTENTVYLYFKDKFVEITKDYIETHDYEELKNCIWKDQILKHNCENGLNKDIKDSDFHQFIKNVTDYKEGENNDRYNSLISSIGYMCSRYKNPSLAKALILCDEGDKNDLDPDDSKGGTGKSLICRSINHVRNTVMIDGKGFKFDNQFKWQKVREDTDIIWINETNKFFPFDKLFSIVTEGIEVEAKNMPSLDIPFERSPKIMIATNYTIPDRSLSTRRRVHEIELAPYYNEKHQPTDDFGKKFFDDWTENEWRDFYVFVFSAIQIFLTHGLITYGQVNLNARKLAQVVDQSFQDYFYRYISEQQRTLEGEIKLSFADFYTAYISTNSAIKGITLTRTTRMIKNILDFNGVNYFQKSDGKSRYILFKMEGVESEQTLAF